ncbi:MAG: hypothetical protein AB2A00_23595 [Myxococcota bacterium]
MEEREREGARHNIQDARERLSEIAGELSRRASPEYVRGKAREAIVRQSYVVKDRALDNPLVLGLFGGLLGAALGGFYRNRRHRHELESYGLGEGYGYGYPRSRRGAGYGGGLGTSPYETGRVGTYRGDVGYREHDVGYRGGKAPSDIGATERGIKAKVGEKAEELKERAQEAISNVGYKASEIKERAAEKADELRERTGVKTGELRGRAMEMRENIPSFEEVRHRGSEFIHYQMENQPLRLALGALAAGAALGFLLPVLPKEREMVEPLRSRARERFQNLEQNISGKVEQKLGEVERKLGGEQQEGRHDVM